MNIQKYDFTTVMEEQKLKDICQKIKLEKCDWDYISSYQVLSESFIREFADKVNWYYISSNQKLSESFIREFADRVDWLQISKYQELSDEFIKEYYCNLYLDELYDSWHRKSTDEKKRKVVETNLYECHEDYFIAYKGLQNNRYSKFNLQYQYLPGETYETFADFSKEESSFGFFVGTKECAEEFNDELIVTCKIYYKDVARVICNGSMIRCSRLTILD